ncbi:MAG: DNA-binding protein [Nitrospirae bacterium]|nr:DNA-binding protein [Nitrospirota bacterium]MBF0591214.1 DNA-binding protein [Nitrospirota bacterium]
MKRFVVIGVVAMFFVTAIVVSANAQPRCGRGSYSGWGCTGQGQGRYQRMYDPQTVTTIAGVVEAVEQFAPLKGMSYGIHLRVKTQEGSISVHVGPAGYVEKQQVKIQVGDNIEVTGSKVTFNNEPAIIAAEIKKDGAILSLRNDSGIPNWAGSGMGRRR